MKPPQVSVTVTGPTKAPLCLTWKEADGTTVTHVEDFETGYVYAAITQPDLTFLTLKGRWTKII
ncbi:hypothetical protein IB237_21565 [Agrobacterium sp. AGB01]|jgi:hypothetical protein|uniref:MoaF-related domain-containing protein n=1 Tax=Agrobacterium sp. AGB01 TaxID=2769302 RepID=UPI0017832B21|nr:hypothetical protein [Agrobacterium sp. AGB01]MBD9389790.1 hypothetical protein [Agrobacterium sp. AGB01]